MRTNMKDMLLQAQQNKYAVGAFNILDYNSMKAVVDAAEELASPVIIQTSAKTVKHWGFQPMVAWYNQLADSVKVPVALHLDHCKDLEFIKKCIDSGWTSVMIDASSKPFEENIELSARVVEMAKPYGVSVEAELGEIGGVEDDISVAEEDAHIADPDKAVTFIERVPVDCFAPAIGTAHGVYKGVPKIAYKQLEEIGKRIPTPLALHGGTGLADDVFLKCIELGCAKVNISTQLKYAHINGFVEYFNQAGDEYNPLNNLKAQYLAVKEAVAQNIELFGSKGKA